MRPLMNKEEGRERLLELGEILDRVEVSYFLILGTALGAYRDKGFVPTERDIDIGFLYEDFQERLQPMISFLQEAQWSVRLESKPFDRTRVLFAEKNGVKADLVSYVKYKDKRFCHNTDPSLTYAIVHDAELLEQRELVSMFDRFWDVPSPCDVYLGLEYGTHDWKEARDTHLSKTRVANFLDKEGINNDYLQQLDLSK